MAIRRKKFLEKVIRNVALTTCGQRNHRNGCYIRFRELKKNEVIDHSETRNDVVVDYDKSGKIVGIEFYEGL